MENIILFGTGAKGKILYRYLCALKIEIMFWVDSDSSKWGTELFGKVIYKPEEVVKYPNATVYISAIDPYDEMRSRLLEMGIKEDHIVKCNEAMILHTDAIFGSGAGSPDCFYGKRKSILVDCIKGLNIGGLEEWSKCLVSGLRTRGHRAYLVAPAGEDDITDDLRDRIIYLEIDRDNLFCPDNVIHLMESVKRHLPCIVITGSVNPFFIAVGILKRRFPESITVISTIHMGTDAVYKEYTDVLSYVDKFAVVSRDIQENMMQRGIPAEQVLHMTCPVACDEKLIRKYTEDGEKPVRLAYAGRVEIGQKRMDLLLLMIQELERRKVKYQFEIAGAGGYLEEMRLFVRQNGLSDRVNLVGKIKHNEIPRFWKRQDICINIADHEGRSLSVMEAMANGAVPVVTATSGVREDIENGRNGYYVDIGDYAGMADKIQYLSENRHLLKIMGNKAHDVIFPKSDINRHMDFWEDVLSEFQENV